jgi:hypothetical protein
MQSQCKKTAMPVVNSQSNRRGRVRFGTSIFLVAYTAIMLSGCALMPLKRFQPVIAPPNVAQCDSTTEFRFLEGESKDFHYQLPNYVRDSDESINRSKSIVRSTTGSGPLFETYHSKIQAAVQARLPAGLKERKAGKVTNAFIDFVTAASGEAQLDAQIADGTLKADKDGDQITAERNAIHKYRAPDKLNHGELKEFSDKLFDLQLKPGAAHLISSGDVNTLGLSDADKQSISAKSFDQTFIKYFEGFYNGHFVDRMGTSLDKPQVSATVPDSEIVAAETVLLEFLIDSIDPTPVMGNADKDKIDTSTVFYPGKSTNQPTAYTTNPNVYIKIPDDGCGITTKNAWVLKDLANGASGQAAAVGGLVANTPGGVSFGLGVLGKISIGDNQTLSVMVKTAASRVALRATLASSYQILRHFKFDVVEP